LIDLTIVGLALWNSKAAIRSQCEIASIGLRRKFLVKTRDCVEIPLTAAFQAAPTGPPPTAGKAVNRTLVQFDYW
jgi:hypothetical protein